MTSKSYAQMDHAHWVHKATRQVLSPLGAQVANILGFAFGGIYNAPINHSKQNWTDEYHISITVGVSGGHLCNWDFPALSLLWIECMRRMVRVEIKPCNPQYLRLEFWQRKTRTGSTSERLPDIEEIVAMVDEMQGRTPK